MILSFLSEAYRVSWSDLCYLRRNFAQTMVSILIMPILYFLRSRSESGNWWTT